MIIHNAKIYTADKNFSIAEAMFIDSGNVVAVGSNDEILKNYSSENKIDAGGKFIYPGFFDPHCHFVYYGLELYNVNLTGTKSFEEVIAKTIDHHKKIGGDWILGRGWDQNDWEVQEFPTKEKLDSLFPDVPVYLVRVDGHAALVNQTALNIAKFDENTVIDGGMLIQKNGRLTGVLIDNAKEEMKKLIPLQETKHVADAILQAQKNCLAVGLTTVADAGLDKTKIDLVDQLQKDDQLKMRVYAMVEGTEDSSVLFFINHGPLKTDQLMVTAMKFYADGALGSRGAMLLEPYADDPTNQGLMIHPKDYFRNAATSCLAAGFQMCAHAIGDSANRLILDVYAEALKTKNDLRWRIEHCQVVNPNDLQKFANYSVIPSIQATHATSDMYWVEERLGPDRVKHGYAYNELLKQNGMIANGSDFPVEDINPLFGFYAAITRQDHEAFPEGGFQIENALTREDALRAMTIWAAYSCFMDDKTGSLEVGKFADFVILDKDIMEIEPKEILSAKVLKTFIDGEKVYELE